MITQIYVDMDGVLSDFLKRYQDLYKETPERDYPSKNQAKKAYRQNWKDFIANNNFATLDPMPDFQMGLKYLNDLQKKGYEIFILSSTANEEFLQEISKQKYEWLKTHGVNFHPIFVPGKALKRHYAGRGKVLIDDTPPNVEQWDQDGGIGILHKNWKGTIDKLDKILDNDD